MKDERLLKLIFLDANEIIDKNELDEDEKGKEKAKLPFMEFDAWILWVFSTPSIFWGDILPEDVFISILNLNLSCVRIIDNKLIISWPRNSIVPQLTDLLKLPISKIT